jgi:hypothetical protein
MFLPLLCSDQFLLQKLNHQFSPLEPSTQINHSTRLHLIGAMLTGWLAIQHFK